MSASSTSKGDTTRQSCKFSDKSRYAQALFVGAGGGSIKTSRGHSPSAKIIKGGKADDDEKSQDQCVLGHYSISKEARGNAFNEYIWVTFLKVDSEMRSDA